MSYKEFFKSIRTWYNQLVMRLIYMVRSDDKLIIQISIYFYIIIITTIHTFNNLKTKYLHHKISNLI